MKNSKQVLLLASLATISVALSSCGPSAPFDGIVYEDLVDAGVYDKYRSIYQIMPYSYADSDGDGVGDLQGIIDKLDYINSLNYSGIWLTPVHPSETYHKYDVDNYKEIDPVFGTLDDYDNLVSKCHENNMTILLDLVVNHSSDTNRWFINCMNAHKNHRPENQYYNYYNVVELKSGDPVPSGYTKSGNFAYESRFWSGMPDLNLQYVLDEPEGYLAKDLIDVFKFWLIDHDIDGFRLDAVTSYFTSDQESNLEFLTWLNEECKKLKPDCYIVGEGSWGNTSENIRYQASGVDSFFNFANHAAGGYIASTVLGDATFYTHALNKNKNAAAGGIEAPFVANHDTGHMIGAVKGRSNVNNLKFGHGVLALLNGTTYTYYGDEIGLAVVPDTDGRDEDKRLPMNFGDNYTPKPVRGASEYKASDVYPYGSVKDQINNSNSVANYVKKANMLRKAFPQIARGTFNCIFTSQDDTFVAVEKTYNNESILILMNAGTKKSYKYDLSKTDYSEPVAELCASGYTKFVDEDKTTIEIPAQGIAIIKK